MACYLPDVHTFQQVRRWGQRTGPRRRLHWNYQTGSDQDSRIPHETRSTRRNSQRGRWIRTEDQTERIPRSWNNDSYLPDRQYPGREGRRYPVNGGRHTWTNSKYVPDRQYPVRGEPQRRKYGPSRNTKDYDIRQNDQSRLPNQGTFVRKIQKRNNPNYKTLHTTSSEDDQFRKVVRVVYNLMRGFHHLGKISTKTIVEDPPTISSVVSYLTNVLKPACITNTTRLLLEGNAKNWAHTSRLILEEHYSQDIEKNTQTLRSLGDTNWRAPFDIAKKWAIRHFKYRLDKETIEKTEALLVSVTAEREEETRAARRAPSPPLSEEDFPSLTREIIAKSLTPPQVQPSWPLVRQSVLQLPQRARRDRREHRPSDQGTDSWVNPAQATVTQHPELETITAYPVSQGDQNASSPKRREESQTTSEHRVLVHARRSHQSTPLRDPDSPVEGEGRQQTEENQQQGVDEIPSRAETPQETQLISLLDENEEDLSSLPPPLLESSPERTLTPRFRPVRHLSTTKKMVEWGLTVRKKWVILGDSNLARIPEYQIENLQIDSYPGGTFRHAEAILSKAHVTTEVEKIILAFGINHKAQKAKETSIKQLQHAVKRAQEQFPRARVWIPVINFSRTLKREEQGALEALNRYIRGKNINCISPLPNAQFSVTADRIHWTTATAKAMLDHWANELNLKAL